MINDKTLLRMALCHTVVTCPTLLPSTLNVCQLLKMESINLLLQTSDQVSSHGACVLIIQRTLSQLTKAWCPRTSELNGNRIRVDCELLW